MHWTSPYSLFNSCPTIDQCVCVCWCVCWCVHVCVWTQEGSQQTRPRSGSTKGQTWSHDHMTSSPLGRSKPDIRRHDDTTSPDDVRAVPWPAERGPAWPGSHQTAPQGSHQTAPQGPCPPCRAFQEDNLIHHCLYTTAMCSSGGETPAFTGSLFNKQHKH